MAIIDSASYITGIHGKVCRHSQDEFRTNTSSGQIVLSKKCNPYTGESTELQKAQQTKFAARVAVVRQWLANNRPSEDNGVKGTALYQEALSLKKSLMKANIQAVLFIYQATTSPYAVSLPSEGGVRNDKTGSNATPSDGGSANPESEL